MGKIVRFDILKIGHIFMNFNLNYLWFQILLIDFSDFSDILDFQNMYYLAFLGTNY